jgi:hypothetical protein
MKKLSLLLFAILLISANLSAEESPIGKWLLIKVEIEGTTQNLFSEVEFKDDGYISMEGRVFGEWEYNNKAKSITIESDMIKEFAGTRTINKLNIKEMVLVGPKVKMYFERLDPKKILKDNTNSGLEGTWKTSMNNMDQTIIFDLPKSITITETNTGSVSTSKGEWIFNSDDNSLILMTRFDGLRGKVKIEEVTEKKLVINSNDEIIKATKLEKSKVKIERLTFNEGDFYDDNGDYKYYGSEEKLPWQDVYMEIQKMEEVASLTYSMSTLIENTETFDTKTLSAIVSANASEGYMEMDNIFNGFDRNNLPEDYEMTVSQINIDEGNYDKKLFPFETSTFRVVDQKVEITTLAGTFTCTSVEFIGSFDENIKIWMINDKLGVIAKVIKDSPGNFGHYIVYDLIEVKLKK